MTPAESDIAEITIVRNREVNALRERNPRMSFSEAWQRTRQTFPHLFGIPARGAAPAATVADQARNRGTLGLAIKSERSLLVEAHIVKNKCSHNIAWNAIRRKRPDLFTTEASTRSELDDSRVVVNRAGMQRDDLAATRAIADEIDKLRGANKTLTHRAARDRVRAKHPELFGLVSINS